MPAHGPGTTTEESAELKRLRRTTPNCEGRSDFKDRVGFSSRPSRPASIANYPVHRRSSLPRRAPVCEKSSRFAQLTELGVPIAPSTYYDHINREPAASCAMANSRSTSRVHAANYGAYGARKCG